MPRQQQQAICALTGDWWMNTANRCSSPPLLNHNAVPDDLCTAAEPVACVGMHRLFTRVSICVLLTRGCGRTVARRTSPGGLHRSTSQCAAWCGPRCTAAQYPAATPTQGDQQVSQLAHTWTLKRCAHAWAPSYPFIMFTMHIDCQLPGRGR